jgi:hypothetical protein
MASKSKPTRKVSAQAVAPPPEAPVEALPMPSAQKPPRKKETKSEAIKSSLTLIVDMLENASDPSTFDEKTLRHNVAVSVKRLKDIVQSLE